MLRVFGKYRDCNVFPRILQVELPLLIPELWVDDYPGLSSAQTTNSFWEQLPGVVLINDHFLLVQSFTEAN